ncbi:hypothetical protein CERSUDRAFT_109821 [Gelatoporia subvermispora B]|uniref:F-box domain-containing protein n=1 Tax=Ceriporiopsis subvermispora (strain B) TaxID=914234 RepID=M2RQN4_CERS8|nr:hypothetical protein CERSUDRAFT_109821 [Gelatoporia subvermispora B]
MSQTSTSTTFMSTSLKSRRTSMRRSELNDSEGYDPSNSGKYETYDSDEHESDESGEYVSCDGEEFGSVERADYDLEDEPSKDVRVQPLSRGSLPVELWDRILKIVDDGRALLAAGCTCKALRDIVEEIVRKRRWIQVFDIASDPTRGYFMHWAQVDVAQFPAWISTYDMKSLRFRYMWIQGKSSAEFLALRPPMRCALSLLTLVTTLILNNTHFLSFSEFARFVCALSNLVTLQLCAVTVDDRGSSTLQGACFARDLHLKWLQIYACAFGESHPIWNLLTAPSLSDSLKHIDARSTASDPLQALQEMIVPSVEFLSENLAGLVELLFRARYPPCDLRSTVCRNALSRSSAGRITAIKIDYGCEHSPPHLNDWRSLFCVLDDTVTAGEFSCLRTISVSFSANHPFDVDSVRTLLSSQSHSSKWTAAFTMSSMVFQPESVDEPHSVREEGSEKTEVAAVECTEGITLCIVMGDLYQLLQRATVRYTRRQSP